MGPLDHLNVVEASRVMPGAILGMMLADHGADVLKVEPHGGGFFAHELSRKAWDRGKHSVELDYDRPADLETLRRLVERADIFIHSLGDAEAARLGLDVASLERANPGLIVCVLEAYGADTPFAGRPYGESLAAAALGTMVDKVSSFREGPIYLGHPALHYGQAFLAAISTLAAVRARRETGKGQTVRASLLDAALAQSPMNNWWQEEDISYIKAGDSGAIDRFGSVRLLTAMFECADGKFLQLHTGGPNGFKSAMTVMGFGDRVQTVKGPEMAVPLSPDEHHIARVEAFDALKQRPRDEWIKLFHAADVAALPVLEPAEVLLDEQVEFANQRIALDDPDFGTIYQAAPAVRFQDTPTAKPRPAPAVGADNGSLADRLARPKPAAAPASRTLRGALEGLRVLDFSSFFACGYAGRLLSDLGADVIKVETPDGDQMRSLPDPFDAAQRGKRDIVLNLKTAEGMAAARRMIVAADVVMLNLRPGKAEKIGLGYEELAALNPRLIYAYLPGYGSKGPKALLKSFAPLVSGWTGLLYEGGGAGNPPTRSVFGNEDYNNGFLGAAAVLMAVEARYVTGKGQYLECPQLHSSLWTTSEHFLDADKQVVYGMRLDKAQQGFNALDRIYRTRDGWVCIACREDRNFAALAAAIGQPGLGDDPRFATPRERSANDAALLAVLEPFFTGQTSMEAFAVLDAAGAPAEIVRETSWVREVFHEDWAARSHRVIESRNTMYGHIRAIGLLNRLDGTPGAASSPAPRLGEHTRELLREAAYSDEEIDGLIARGAAFLFDPATEAGRVRVSAA